MALKQIMINKKLEEKRAALEAAKTKMSELATREAELETAIDEAETDEEKETVEKEIEKFEQDKEAAEKEQTDLEAEIAGLEAELEQERSKNPNQVKKTPKDNEQRGEHRAMAGSGVIKRGAFSGRTIEERAAILAQEEVQEFLERARNIKAERRGVSGAELNIPDVLLELLKDTINRYSKLISCVRVKPVPGKSRQNIAGTVPEGIWVEAKGALKELEISFNQVEMDGYKVGGYIAIANSTLEDSDVNLAEEILDALGQAIGYAVDKAILYGKGIKMPTGIVTRLSQTAKPDTWEENAPDWIDLHTTNVLTLNIASKTGKEFFSALMEGLGTAEANYSDGRMFWAMSSKTKKKVYAKAITFDSAGAIVAKMNDEMPVIGGKIIELPFIPDDNIIGGYGSLYTLAERKGTQLAQSDQAMFVEDMTVFKGTARYDGKPIIATGFVVVSISASAPTTALDFATGEAEASGSQS